MRAVVCALSTGLFLNACGPDEGKTDGRPDAGTVEYFPALGVAPAGEKYADKTLEEWAVEYMRWYYSWTSDMCQTAENDPDGSRCGFNQPANSPVFFFGSCEYSRKRDTVVMRDQCKVPYGKAILVPISVIGDDDAGSEDAPRTPEEIADNVATIAETMRELRLVADDVAVEGLSDYKVGPLQFAFDVQSEPNWHSCNYFEGVENTTVDASFVAGYFALFKPPSIGEHHLEYSGVYTYFERDYFRNIDARFEVITE